MIKSEYKVNKRDFFNKKNTILKRLIIRTLKAYTLIGFSLDEENNTVTCKVKFNKGGFIREHPKRFATYYYTTDIPDNELEINLSLHVTIVEPDPS